MNGTWHHQCTDDLNNGHVSTADADISGIGVVLAFILSAYITLAVVLYCYFAGFIENELLNDIDRRIFRIRPYKWNHPSLFSALRRTVLVYGDQQIVTGIAIMAAGFQGLRTGTISVYHYQIVLYLAWMASSVHLSALTILGTTLTSNKGLMIWRLAGMFVLFVLLLVALVPTTSNLWAGSGLNQPWSDDDSKKGWGIPAKCFWDFRFVAAVNPDAPFGYLILIYSYLWKFGGLFPSLSRGYNQYIRFPVERFLWYSLRHAVRKANWRYHLVLIFALPLLAFIDCLASFATSLWISVLGLIFGTIQVIIPRMQNQPFTGAQESQWGFGQLVPIVLLVQPLGILVEFCFPAEEEKKEIQARYGPNSVAAHRPSEAPPMPVPPTALDYFTKQLESITVFDGAELASLRLLLCHSKLFATLVWVIQFCIICTAATAFEFDASTIGNTSDSNWFVVLSGVGVFIVASISLVAVLAPFSRLGKTRSDPGSRARINEEGNSHSQSLPTVEMDQWEGKEH